MEQLLQLFSLIPLLGFIVTLFFRQKEENAIATIAIGSVGLQLFGLILFIMNWIANGSPILDIKHFTFYKEDNVEIFIDLYFDKITAVFALVGSLITFLVAIFSRFYLHRDSGFKRFFSTLLLFFFAYSLIIFSGNFETLFIGWEFLGITSFLLIIFYRDRYLPVKNGLKTISLYRLSDVCLMLSLWMSHHLWHENITFIKLNDLDLVMSHIDEHRYYASFIVLMIVIAAAIKSAQFPFSSWLTRAMEGPTTSSAIFYGSLSAHIGVFLLMRTYPYWETIFSIKLLVIVVGIVTAIVATLIARVQSSVKTQIAYGSIAQIGIMFFELAMGWHTLVLVHFTGNAFLRTYQLLVSPSVLGYLIHDQFFSYIPKRYGANDSFINKITNSIYVLSLKEWNLDAFQFKILWSPFKWIGRKLNFLSHKTVLTSLIIIYAIGIYLFLNQDILAKELDQMLHIFFAFIGMLLILKSFAKRTDAIKVWFMIIASQFYILLSIAFLNDEYEYVEILIYISGLLIAACGGFYSLYKLKAIEKNIDLNDFYGYNHDHPKYGFWFLISCLAFVGLPFTPTFIGVDLMFSHIDKNEYVLITITAISFLFIEISVLRIYARLFLGPNKKQNHPIAYRSS
ncbi:proton-conducting transporter membrane subunit [Flavobacterium sp.]|uniref:proton-conducting transporter transmembrane domain-containing protein n=1 Tax=Flavobacterium sp. TaxID=239 RepID=UPI00286B9A96|nr:proton-conducting transporter membrane subunit [Flavobacterium sp.]